MNSVACYFLDGPKAGTTMPIAAPPRPILSVPWMENLPDWMNSSPDPGERVPIETIEYRLHEFSDETHQARVYASEMDKKAAFWAYVRIYAQDNLPKIKLLLCLAEENGVTIRVRASEIQLGVVAGPGLPGWTPWQEHVTEFLSRYYLLIAGFFELMGLREP